MESVFKTKITEAKDKKLFIKIIFQYPSSDRAVIKRGYVTDVFDDGFELEEIYDGSVSFSFNYIVEIKEEDKNK